MREMHDMACMDFSQLGDVVREARHKHGYTQTQLADLAGVGRNTISEIENGTFDELGVRKIQRVCCVLHLELSVGPVTFEVDNDADELAAAEEADRRIEKSRGGFRP